MVLTLTDENAGQIRQFGNVLSVERISAPDSLWEKEIFPHNPAYPWNLDNFGPLYIPKKGDTLKLDSTNIVLYNRLIDAYELNDLEVINGKIFINGKETSEYVVKMDYYWMMGDNRHNSADSRVWGFVPDDHIVGKAVFVWLSLDPDKGLFDGKIRWNKMFRLVK